MMRWFRKPAGDPLAVSMSGLKLGDRLLVLGCSDPRLIAALASKVGLTGRACMLDQSAEQTTRAAAAVEEEGALVESFTSPMTSLPFDANAFDVVVARNLLPHLRADLQRTVVEQVTRVVRPGGRCIVIDDVPRSGLGGLLGGSRESASGGSVGLLTAAGFRGVRTLAEREGFVFVEGVKPGQRA